MSKEKFSTNWPKCTFIKSKLEIGNWKLVFSNNNDSIFNIYLQIYSRLAFWLTDLECLRTQKEYDDSITLKLFALQFVNYYSSIIYIAFFKGRLVDHNVCTFTFDIWCKFVILSFGLDYNCLSKFHDYIFYHERLVVFSEHSGFLHPLKLTAMKYPQKRHLKVALKQQQSINQSMKYCIIIRIL